MTRNARTNSTPSDTTNEAPVESAPEAVIDWAATWNGLYAEATDAKAKASVRKALADSVAGARADVNAALDAFMSDMSDDNKATLEAARSHLAALESVTLSTAPKSTKVETDWQALFTQRLVVLAVADAIMAHNDSASLGTPSDVPTDVVLDIEAAWNAVRVFRAQVDAEGIVPAIEALPDVVRDMAVAIASAPIAPKARGAKSGSSADDVRAAFEGVEVGTVLTVAEIVRTCGRKASNGAVANYLRSDSCPAWLTVTEAPLRAELVAEIA